MKFQKGMISWNKGKKGYHRGHKPYIVAKGEDNPFYGKKHSKETKEKMRMAKLGKPHFQSEETKIKIGLGNKGRKGISGEKHYNWKGGITPLNRKLRTSAMWRLWREAIFLRDNFTCQNPKCEFCENIMGVNLHPHHIKSLALYPELAFKVENGITYCEEYHLKTGLHRNMQVEV